ncbi:Chaperone DnaJ-domain superfamily protein [Raphanus sativus]|uniref:Uncharacterized protein LOC108861082 n=1 Tax=Raphanus sativus TaxID=3726 RepID=A0A6J0P183_RAPSA|nr:uncharacterized protein LOC108861082 [Raphanus sativus]KAJ4896116.1 Chaperone DnaJ-domain superfamily protein [Raphanus sativus]
MIAAVRAAILKAQSYSSNVKTVLFHSTPILQRKHKSNSETRNKKLSRSRAKQDLRRNVNAFAEHLFGIWSDGFDYSDKHTSWFEKQYFRVCKRNRIGSSRYIHQRLDKSCFDFSGVDDECEIEYFLRSALGGSYKQSKSRWRERHFYGSNRQEEGEARSWRYSNNSNTGRSRGSRQRLDQEEEKEEEEEEQDERSSTEVNDLDTSQQSHRQTLGLSSSGPLNLGDVKKAYRVCALKWHPDLHPDSTKNAAEEKFKLCTVAYESLCEKFAMNQ